MPAQLVETVHLCRGVYAPYGTDLPPVEVVCQVVALNGTSYVWIDGISAYDPVLLPAHVLDNAQRMGALRDYLQDPKHEDLGDDFEVLLDLAMVQRVSATTLVRACEIMHIESANAYQAMATAVQWGITLCELDQTHRAEYKLISQGNAMPA